MAGEEAGVLPHCGHDLVDAEERQDVNNGNGNGCKIIHLMDTFWSISIAEVTKWE